MKSEISNAEGKSNAVARLQSMNLKSLISYYAYDLPSAFDDALRYYEIKASVACFDFIKAWA